MFGLYDKYPYFEVYLADGKKYMFDLEKRCVVKTAHECHHGDWKTDIVHLRGAIPADTEVEVKGHFFNYYGHYLQVEYNGITFDVESSEVFYIRLGTK